MVNPIPEIFKRPHRTHRFRLHTAQLQLYICCFRIFPSTAFFLSVTKSRRSASLRHNQNLLIRSRSSLLFLFFSVVETVGVVVVALTTGAVVDSLVVLGGCVMVGAGGMDGMDGSGGCRFRIRGIRVEIGRGAPGCCGWVGSWGEAGSCSLSSFSCFLHSCNQSGRGVIQIESDRRKLKPFTSPDTNQPVAAVYVDRLTIPPSHCRPTLS